jgi:hypothetical protein
MTDEQINIAIAEACGYKNVTIGVTEGTIRVVVGYKHHTFDEEIPDYCNDLNAMHEAEKIFDAALYCRYINELCDLTIKGKNCMYMATARQRAEAFLKTIKKWNSDKILL